MNREFFESEAGQAVVKRVPQRRIGSPRDLEGASSSSPRTPAPS